MYLDTLVKWQILYADVWSIRIFATHTCFWLWTYQNNFETLKPKPNETTELVSAETYERNHFGKKPKPKHTNETILEKSRNRNIRTKPFWKKTETETYERNNFGKKPKPKHTNETILKKSRTKPICFGGFGIYILMIVGIDINYSLCLPLLCNTLLKEEEYTSFTRGDSQMKTHNKAIFQILHTPPRPSRTYVKIFWVHSLAPQVRFFLTEATWLLKTRPACKTNFASLVLPPLMTSFVNDLGKMVCSSLITFLKLTNYFLQIISNTKTFSLLD